MRYLLLLALRKPKANVPVFPEDPPDHGLLRDMERAHCVCFRPPQGQASEQPRVSDLRDWKKRAVSPQHRSAGTDLGDWDSCPSEGA